MNTDIFSVIYTDEKKKKIIIEFSNFKTKEEQIEFVRDLNHMLGLFSLIDKEIDTPVTIH